MQGCEFGNQLFRPLQSRLTHSNDLSGLGEIISVCHVILPKFIGKCPPNVEISNWLEMVHLFTLAFLDCNDCFIYSHHQAIFHIPTKSRFIFTLFWRGRGTHLAGFRAYSCLCTKRSLLARPRIHMVCGELRSRSTPRKASVLPRFIFQCYEEYINLTHFYTLLNFWGVTWS